VIWQWDENFDIGADTGTPVSSDYQEPFRFTGRLNKLTLTIDRPQLTPEDIKRLRTVTETSRSAIEGSHGKTTVVGTRHARPNRSVAVHDGRSAVPRLAAPCTLGLQNHSEITRFRLPDGTLNLRVEGSIPSWLTT
jgi:hypothetical protein